MRLDSCRSSLEVSVSATPTYCRTSRGAASTWIFCGDEAAARRRRGYAVETSRGAVAASAWIVRGDETRRRRGCDVDIPRRRVAAAAGVAATWNFGRDRPRRDESGVPPARSVSEPMLSTSHPQNLLLSPLAPTRRNAAGVASHRRRRAARLFVARLPIVHLTVARAVERGLATVALLQLGAVFNLWDATEEAHAPDSKLQQTVLNRHTR